MEYITKELSCNRNIVKCVVDRSGNVISLRIVGNKIKYVLSRVAGDHIGHGDISIPMRLVLGEDGKFIHTTSGGVIKEPLDVVGIIGKCANYCISVEKGCAVRASRLGTQPSLRIKAEYVGCMMDSLEAIDSTIDIICDAKMVSPGSLYPFLTS